jgi:hypothetical protein
MWFTIQTGQAENHNRRTARKKAELGEANNITDSHQRTKGKEKKRQSGKSHKLMSIFHATGQLTGES